MVLKKAIDILEKNDPSRNYGEPVDNFNKTAQIVSELINKKISSKDICIVYIVQKLVRESYYHKEDNLIDASAYIEILNILNK